ncbi:T9SS type A sorting domain-containing protein, partial [candidate division KSB1 bacterium]|nr:T9SS type A sorting domain-containing protein [candidate division KSB1 bacterium]
CGYITIGDADIANIKNAILRQPLAANYVVYDDFFSYSTGVYEHAWGEVAGGHVILIIGWDDERECWICKNSWGMNWGETADFKPYKAGAQNGGYFRIKWGECEIGKNCLYIYDNLTGPALTTTPKQFDLQVATGDSLQESFTIHNLGQEPLEYWTSSWGGASFFHVDSFMAFDDLSWWCGDPQINGYQNGWLQFLDTPLLDLSGTSAPRLTWMGYWALEDTTGVAGYQPYDGWDGCNVWISDDGGTTFTVAEPLQPRFTSRNLWSFGGWWYMGDNIPGWGGSSGGWQEIQNDLSLYQHDSVVVRFAFASDAALATADDSQLNGFFVDEILVTDGEALLFANHGDENNGMRASGEIQEAADWLRTVDAAGFLPAGESAIAQLRISSRGLKPGNYLGRLIILSNDTTAAKYFLPVKLRVRKPAFDIGVRQARPISAQVPLFLELHPAVTIENQGFADAENFNLVCQAQVAGKVVYSDARSIASLAAGSAQTIAFTPLSFTELGRVSLTVALADAPDDNPDNDQVVSVFDISNAIDDFATETGNWHFGAGWAIDENEAHTSPGAARLTEAPSLDGCLTFLPALDLSNTQAATLKFWTRYETEQGKDICYVEASHDSLTWIKLDSLSGVQWPRWAQREVSLAAFVGRERERTWFRFHYVSDSVTLLRGVIIDDIEIYAEHPTAVQSAQDRTLPQAFSLSQNYPNPFNAGTTIEYALPRTTFVTLQVYNLRGEQVAALVAEQREAGVHRIRWDARELASGVYLYQLAAGEFLQSKKLILMR